MSEAVVQEAATDALERMGRHFISEGATHTIIVPVMPGEVCVCVRACVHGERGCLRGVCGGVCVV